MYCVKQVKNDLYWVGASDRRLALFENVYPIPNGVSYNAYVLMDEKTVLLDTVDRAVSEQFFENVEHVLGGRKLDYVIVNHMEPDHCATLAEVVRRYPEVTVVCNAKTQTMIKQFFTFDIAARVQIVKEKDLLVTGAHTLTFVMTPMVHWPEVMMTYDATDKVLFSADAFGTFGAINGNLFADECNFETECLDDARRYYTNIVGKYGTQVQAALRKASAIEIETLCPLHGPVWRKDIGWFVEKYSKWATYTPEEDGVVIAYASVYGHTENAANIIASKLADQGVRNIKMYDVSATHASVIISEAFRVSHLIFCSTTYNAGIFVNMENLLHDLAAHNLQNRTVALVENGSWAPTSGSLMHKLLDSMKNVTVLEAGVTLRSALKEEQLGEIDALVEAVVHSMRDCEEAPAEAKAGKVEDAAMFKLSYGLFVLTAKEDCKDNGCIINTAGQLTVTPNRISIAVNKANYTHDMIKRTGLFNISILSTEADFSTFKRFGFQSGRDANKFCGYEHVSRSANGVTYVTEGVNAFISGKVVQMVDLGTHTLFIADVTEAQVLNGVPSATYQYYFDHIKPKPNAIKEQKGWVCKICGYVYDGEELPEDFICPLCKHPASDFEKA